MARGGTAGRGSGGGRGTRASDRSGGPGNKGIGRLPIGNTLRARFINEPVVESGGKPNSVNRRNNRRF